MKTFCLQTLGCKVNQYESEQVVSLLRARGMVETTPDRAELRIINSCSVTVQAASQSRQETRRMTRLAVLSDKPASDTPASQACVQRNPSSEFPGSRTVQPRVLVMGCWATSDKAEAANIAGVDAVLTHQNDIAADLNQLLETWSLSHPWEGANQSPPHAGAIDTCAIERPPESTIETGWMKEAGSGAGDCTPENRPKSSAFVNENPMPRYAAGSIAVSPKREGEAPVRRSSPKSAGPDCSSELRLGGSLALPFEARVGANSLPVLGGHQSGRQRAFLKLQDGCDAHCTYCIIPRLRPVLFSKPPAEAVEEARRLVDAGHVEIVLTGIFLGAYGQPTALRRRQPAGRAPLAELVESLCTQVPGLKRLRLSSLEPGDLTDDLLAALTSHQQVVPHFHLPLQSGCDAILRRMNRQYRRDDLLRMVDRVNAAFDRPALTTDIIVGFPGEAEAEFEQTVSVAEHAGFIHIHAFPYSPRPGTAAARWVGDYVRGPVVNERIRALKRLAGEQSHRFRSQFIGQTVEVIIERDAEIVNGRPLLHGRCERYFPVYFEPAAVRAGDAVRLRIDQVTETKTFASIASEDFVGGHA
jgi:MiaB/RimO family radical SAM methylthiotransferase